MVLALKNISCIFIVQINKPLISQLARIVNLPIVVMYRIGNVWRAYACSSFFFPNGVHLTREVKKFSICVKYLLTLLLEKKYSYIIP